MQTVEFMAGDHGSVLVELSEHDTPAASGIERAGFTDAVRKATVSFETAVSSVRPVAEVLVSQFAEMRRPPTDITVSFGLKLSGSTSAKIVSAAAESHIDVTMTWSAKTPEDVRDGNGKAGVAGADRHR